MGEDYVRKIWKQYFEDINKVNRDGQITVSMPNFENGGRSNYSQGEPVNRYEVEARTKKLKNGKASLITWE